MSKLTSDIDALHNRCNTLRRKLGHAQQPATDVAALKQQHSRPEAALMHVRDQKVAELQLLALRCCGHSTRHCHGANAPKQPNDHFNLALLLAVTDCMSQQSSELRGYSQRHEALQRENRALRESAGIAAPSVPSGAASRAASRPGTAAPHAHAQPSRPPSSLLAARPAPAGPGASRPSKTGDEDDASSEASGRTMAATAAATMLLGGGRPASAAASMAEPRRPACMAPPREAFGEAASEAPQQRQATRTMHQPHGNATAEHRRAPDRRQTGGA